MTAAVDRRQTSQEMLILIQQIHENQMAFDQKLTQIRHDDTLLLGEELSKLLIRAFPEGDPDGHRAHHESVIKAAEAKAAFWQKMVFEISRWGLIGFIAWAGLALWNAAISGPHK